MRKWLAFLQGHVPPVLRTVLEILPMLCPTEHIPSMWLILLRDFSQYLPRLDSTIQIEEDDAEEVSTSDRVPGIEIFSFLFNFPIHLTVNYS